MALRVLAIIRPSLDEVAGSILEGLSQQGDFLPVERISVVLPASSTWPDTVEAEHFCEALTSILSTGWGKPSGVEISVKGPAGKGDVRTWPLPCALHRNSL
jgi:hypothetical protein